MPQPVKGDGNDAGAHHRREIGRMQGPCRLLEPGKNVYHLENHKRAGTVAVSQPPDYPLSSLHEFYTARRRRP